MVWLAQNVQDELTGGEFVQWPIDGRRLLDPRIVNDRTGSAIDPVSRRQRKKHVVDDFADGVL